MSIVHIMATIRCDGCNEPFVLTLDRALTTDKMQDYGYDSIDDYVWDLVRGPNVDYGIATSVQGNHLLCKKCTDVIDEAFPDDTADLTHDQVCAALNEKAGV